MIEYLNEFADQIQTYLLNSAECEVDFIMVTAGRPSAPVGTDCRGVYVFVDNIADKNQFSTGEDCMSISRLTVSYEIHSCLPVEAEDLTAAQALAAAECLYWMMDAIWCGIVSDKDSGELMGVGSCSEINIGSLEVQRPLGGNISALGTVTIPLPC